VQARPAAALGVSAGLGRRSPTFGQSAAFPPLGVDNADLPVTEGRHSAARVAVPAGAAGSGQVTQWRSAPLTQTARHRRSLPVPLRDLVTEPTPSGRTRFVSISRNETGAPDATMRDHPATTGLGRAPLATPSRAGRVDAGTHDVASRRRTTRPRLTREARATATNPQVSYPKRLKPPALGSEPLHLLVQHRRPVDPPSTSWSTSHVRTHNHVRPCHTS
jgi:hypothetical protein